ncbi:endoribonuclease YbeY isoform X2 [Rhinopithecus roxellana]|nr:endoribonuclease YbeY isoform X2 [Rhinopithecus roxellana]
MSGRVSSLPSESVAFTPVGLRAPQTPEDLAPSAYLCPPLCPPPFQPLPSSAASLPGRVPPPHPTASLARLAPRAQCTRPLSGNRSFRSARLESWPDSAVSFHSPSLLHPPCGSVANIFKGLVILREMSLVIRNLQRVIPIRRAPLRSKIEIVRRILGVQKFDLGIICVDNKNIRHINRIYRDRNVPTDVLSFPFHEHLKAGEFPLPDFPDDYNLGDIFLGVEYIFHQCKEDEDYNDVLTVTATHGLCHLLGFTHSTEAEWLQKLDLRPALGKMTHRCLISTPGSPDTSS